MNRLMTTEEKIAKSLPGVSIKVISSVCQDAYKYIAEEGDTRICVDVSGIDLLKDEKGFITKFIQQFEEKKNAKVNV